MKKEIDEKTPPLAARLHQLMKKTGVNKSALARICGVTPQSAGKWFKNGSISKESAKKIAEAFGVSLSWLLGDEVDVGEVLLDDDFQPLVLTERQKLLITLFERLPESAKDNQIAALQEMVKNYDSLFNELLKNRKLDEIIQAKKEK
ncbi:helix-turn-helix domain-containing protein [Mixta intestinalis]|uniref:HTH cro/C1-type domain-containing protein n=1 Tax=Mixta intestinalis TaxID=1615494 RepID=A0A6P1PXC1_9GAMM|nr:helix-turn-helix domain-containing protein [Mixta intestinalis]QHM70684.1 hypothetical protein C7M51_00962 [Mixta intestinalis]